MTGHIERFCARLELEGATPGTVGHRRKVLKRLELEHGELIGLTAGDLEAYLAARTHAATRASYRAVVRRFYAWALDEQLVDVDPSARLPRVRVKVPPPRPVSDELLAELLRRAHGSDRTIVLLMAYCGLRSSEVAGLEPSDLEHNGSAWQLRVRCAKGGGEQLVTVPAWVVDEVAAGLPVLARPSTVRERVRRLMRACGSTATPHALRHWYGTNALRAAGGNLRVAQTMMRHASPATTARYTLVTAPEVAQAAEGLPRVA